MKRRKFLQVAGVSTAGIAAAACSGTEDHWMPYVATPEDETPGIPTYYASTCRECPAGCGILVKTREGRPIKIEGNPEHPVNRGRLCARGQAALQGLYDPDRVTQPMKRNGTAWSPITWEQAEAEVSTALGAAAGAGRDRIAFISGAASGPLDRVTDAWLSAFGSSRRLRYEAFGYEPLRAANEQTFGVNGMASYDFGAAKYIVSFGADFLETWVSPTHHNIGFAEAHSPKNGEMAKFVAVEPRRGQTGFSADEWVAPKVGTEHLVALAMANVIAGSKGNAGFGGMLAAYTPDAVAGPTGIAKEVIERLAHEFAAASPSLAVAGGVAHQHSAALQTALAANILNIVAGNVGRTVSFPGASIWDRVATFRDMQALVTALNAGSVDVVMVQGTNPVYTWPGEGFAAALGKAKLKVSFSSYLDDTAALCDLILPDHHFLESWDVAEPMTGISGIVQPVVRPIHPGTKQTFDVLLSLAQKAGKNVVPAGVTSAREMVNKSVANLQALLPKGGTWTAPAAKAVRAAPGRGPAAAASIGPATFTGASDGLVLLTVPSPMLHDGRGANKSWLQEVPDPATKIAWQTWVEVHPQTAARLGLATGDMVNVTAGQRHAEAIVMVYPGVRPDVVAMPIGRGHAAYGRYAQKGTNPLRLLDPVVDASGGLAFCQTKVTLVKTGRSASLATTEGSSRQFGRGISRLMTMGELARGRHPEGTPEEITAPEKEAVDSAAVQQARKTYVEIYSREHPKWEMTIDLARCTGCSACVVACNAENNVPTVGEDQVIRSREMAWIRIERYYEGDTNGTDFQVAQIPMLCQQCANAPCEPVCPVYAAYHTPDGLNGQVYNRCVGTRYCANNCPYKVRYFNFWDYGREGAPKHAFPGTLTWMLNPDVTVRTKGVMEKCTFCVQRIRFAQNDARVRGTTLTDGAITTACAQTCPSNAITFGDAHDPESRVNRIKQDQRGYHVFEQLNTKPGITYLARVIHGAEGGEA